MAFVNAPVTCAGSSSTFLGRRPTCTARTSAVGTVKMGYGDYSYLTDKSQGHMNNYYIDKFRIAADFIKGQPKSDADAKLGRDAKGAVVVPKEGVPQIADGILARDPSNPEDPRIAESEGAVWEWDRSYVDPALAPESYADVNDAQIIDDSFQRFRDASAAERGRMLTAQDLGSTLKNKLRLQNGFDEKTLLTLEGQHDRLHALTEHIMEVPFLTPTGAPQTEIPGTPYLPSVGALDFQRKPQAEINFWKDPTPPPAVVKRPKGAGKAELPYNTAPSVGAIKEDQVAAGLIPSAE